VSLAKLVLRSLRYYWRSNIAVVCGAAVAVAVLVGSLAVGDSVQGSLRALALERLGRVEVAVSSPFYFREKLAEDLAGQGDFEARFQDAVPAIILEATARHTGSDAKVPKMTMLGVRQDFASLAEGGAALTGLEGRGVALNATLADELGAEKGDTLLVTAGQQVDAPAESVFAREDRSDTLLTLRVRVSAVLPASGIGRFTLRNDEPRPRNVYVSLSWLQRQLDRSGQVNTILVASERTGEGARRREAAEKMLHAAVTLADLGLFIEPNERQGYLSLESERLVLPAPAVEAVGGRSAPGITTVYLANWITLIRDGDPQKRLPYAVVAGLHPDAEPPLGALPMIGGGAPPKLEAGDILLNKWAADDLGAKAGDAVELTYYIPGPGGALKTDTARCTVRGVVAMTGAALDPDLVPTFKGLTDAESMGDWNPPFPIDDERIRRKDEDYWEEHRATPKAFLRLEDVARLWTQKAEPGVEGWVTSVRLAPSPHLSLAGAAERRAQSLARELDPAQFGLALRPVREQALQAAKGSTDFGVLFLSMSFFLVVAAAALIFLLLRLTAERRAGQFGILVATGFTGQQAARVLVGEGTVLAALGTVLGAPLGVAYAAAIIQALRTWWAGAVGEFPLALHVSPVTLIGGAVCGFAVALVALWWSARMLRRARALSLLAGWRSLLAEPQRGARRRARFLAVVCLAGAAVLLVLSLGLGALSPTGAFFGIGAAVLVGALAGAGDWLQRPRVEGDKPPSLAGLAVRESSRHWLRSLLTVGLLAAASFLIVTVATNRRDLSRLDTRALDSGAGGFNLMARSSVPVHADITTASGREKLGFSGEASDTLGQCLIVPLRATAGEDASCLNIQRPTAPRVLGVPATLIDRGGFAFATHRPLPQGEENPWRLLERPAEDGVMPAFADQASAQWILKVGLGDVIEVPTPAGGTARLKLVGLLSQSIFQSELLIAEQHFREHFGAESGYRAFVVRTPPGSTEAAVSALRQGPLDLSFEVRETAEILNTYARVQNTYLSTFTTLGGMGLLLGTFGLVAVLLRSIVERRSELAMMLALGFRPRAIFAKIVVENAVLLLLGLVIGTAAALVAVAPHLASTVANVPWGLLAGTLAACLVAGVLACSVAAGGALRGDLLAALRSE
jgi:ABC-type lipoprotein release transport system permease subunit